jgi:hypothetical protein
MLLPPVKRVNVHVTESEQRSLSPLDSVVLKVRSSLCSLIARPPTGAGQQACLSFYGSAFFGVTFDLRTVQNLREIRRGTASGEVCAGHSSNPSRTNYRVSPNVTPSVARKNP